MHIYYEVHFYEINSKCSIISTLVSFNSNFVGISVGILILGEISRLPTIHFIPQPFAKSYLRKISRWHERQFSSVYILYSLENSAVLIVCSCPGILQDWPRSFVLNSLPITQKVLMTYKSLIKFRSSNFVGLCLKTEIIQHIKVDGLFGVS
jgi:hypothetical protein